MCEATWQQPPAEVAEFSASTDTPATLTAAPTIGGIFRQYGAAYLQKYAHRMSQDQLKAMAMLQRCRTGELGSVLYGCRDCGRRHFTTRSCGNRHCPVCQGEKAKQWLQTQLDKLLPCAYFLITFTVPEELRCFVRSHPRECYRALFDTAAASLIELAKNPKFIGSSKLGFTGVLHTWGRSWTAGPDSSRSLDQTLDRSHPAGWRWSASLTLSGPLRLPRGDQQSADRQV